MRAARRIASSADPPPPTTTNPLFSARLRATPSPNSGWSSTTTSRIAVHHIRSNSLPSELRDIVNLVPVLRCVERHKRTAYAFHAFAQPGKAERCRAAYAGRDQTLVHRQTTSTTKPSIFEVLGDGLAGAAGVAVAVVQRLLHETIDADLLEGVSASPASRTTTAPPRLQFAVLWGPAPLSPECRAIRRSRCAAARGRCRCCGCRAWHRPDWT